MRGSRSARSKWWFMGTALISALLIAVLLSSQHRLRLIVGSFETFDSSSVLPGSFQFLPHASITNAPSFSSDVATLHQFDRAYPLLAGDALPALDDPDTCLARLERGDRMHCYNVDIACAQILARRGAPTRLWDFNGSSELGGDGHNLIEVFDSSSQRWKAIDPYYHCFYTLGDSVPIGARQLRETLLAYPGRVHLVRYSDTSRERPDSQIVAELTFLAPGAMLHENNNFAWRYAHRYGWLTAFAAPLFDGLPLREARGVRTIMLGSHDRLLVVEDRFSPHFPFMRMKVAFYGLLALLVLSILGLIVSVRNRGQRHRF